MGSRGIKTEHAGHNKRTYRVRPMVVTLHKGVKQEKHEANLPIGLIERRRDD